MAEPLRTGVGAELKRARDAAGLGLDDVARQLKLLPRQVESLEDERFDRLPGPSIARGMVRNYARLLELDPEPLVERMAPRAQTAAETVRIAAPQPRRASPLWIALWVALVAMIGALAYEWRQQKPTPELHAPAAAQRADQATPAIQVPPAVSESAPAVEEKAEDPLEPAAEPAPPPAVHRLLLSVEEEAWLEVRDGAGRSLVSSLNPAGSERAVRGQPPFQLVIGNAAHVRLSYDGQAIDLKPYVRGEVARFTLK